MPLSILRLGHPLLRQVARPLSIEELKSETIQTLIDEMIETMRAANGAGLAAPQVGHSVRLCVAEVNENPRYPGMGTLPLRIWVNPHLSVAATAPASGEPTDSETTAPAYRRADSASAPVLAPTGQHIAMYEGCLSVPGLRGRVVRPAQIKVESLDRWGEAQAETFNGPLAAVAQHECDHLDGVLFVDRSPPTTFTFLEEYEQFVPVEDRVQILVEESKTKSE